MLISVIIPNYNYAQYLEQCLKSVLESELGTYKIEIIVVDDASTDDSVKVIEKIKSKSRFPFCVIKNETNMGVLLCRNRGIAYAQGDFLFFLDSDNYINKDCIKIHTNTLRQNPDATACYAPIQDFMNSTGEYCGQRSNQAFDYQKLLEGPYIDAMAMFRKNDLIELGKYDNKMPAYGWEDYELWLRLGKMGTKVIFIQGKPLSFYRVHEVNKSQNYKPDQFNHIIYYLHQKYPIKQLFKQTETLDNLILQKNHFAQLYYKTINSEYKEDHSLITAISIGPKKILFKFDNPLFVNNLRFDPLNDYVKIRINSIQLLNLGKVLCLDLKVSSNALYSEKEEYLFDTTDPHVFIDFPHTNSVEIDEVIVELDYIQNGTELITTLLKHKDFEIDLNKDKTRILTESLQTSEFLKHGLENKLVENNLIIQEQTEKLGLQTGLLYSLKTSNEELLKQFNNMEMQIKGLESELFTIKKNYGYKFSRLFKTLLLLLHPLKLKTKLKVKFDLNKNIKLLQQSGYFDNDYYIKNYPDVKLSRISAIKHYLLFGGFEGRNPSAKFDSAFYLQQNIDVKHSGMNPLLHYILYGEKEGRSFE